MKRVERRSVEPELIGVVDHPVAGPSIRRAKSLGGLAGFGVTLGLGLFHGALFSTACLRALAAGIAGYLVVWCVAVTVWRHLLRAQARAAVARAIARRAVGEES